MEREKINKMRACSRLLPDPGGEVVRECLDEIERLRAENERLEMLLQMAHCQKISADTPHGLGCCDNYRDWLSSLLPNA